MDGRRRFNHALAALAIALAAWSAAAAHAQPPDLAVGQLWSVKGGPMKVVIGRIEPWGRGETAVSVSIIDIPTDRGPKTVGHAPFDKAALTGSLDKLLATGAAPDPNFESGYAQWKSGHGGIFTISVPLAVALAFDVLKQAKPQSGTGASSSD